MSSLYGRTEILRKGFNSQDLIALDAIEDFIEHEKRSEWIYIEADAAGSIDDIVIKKRMEVASLNRKNLQVTH